MQYFLKSNLLWSCVAEVLLLYGKSADIFLTVVELS